MKGSLPSISTGSLLTVVASLTGKGMIEAIVLAFIGGVAGYLGKLLIEFIIKLIKKVFNNEKVRS